MERKPQVDVQGHERRVVSLSGIETRAAEEDGPIGFKGQAAVFNSRTAIGDPMRWGFWEQVAPGAFKDTIKTDDVRFLINHDPNLILARNTAGTLTLAEKSGGLATEAELAPTTYGRDLAISLDRGDVSQMSFAFRTVKDTWETQEDGSELRTIEKVQLFDVSAVTYPAYTDTSAALRSATFDLLCARMGVDPEEALAQIRAGVAPVATPVLLAEDIRLANQYAQINGLEPLESV